MIFKRKHCTDCDRPVRAEMQTISHFKHFIVTCLSAGIWLPFWLICALIPRRWMCPMCGGSRFKGLFG